jgi:DNA-binding response OmpR family regulator
MNLLTREVTRAGQVIELQSREFALLELLMRNPERFVPLRLAPRVASIYCSASG